MASINPACCLRSCPSSSQPRWSSTMSRIAMLSLALIGHDSITDDTVQHPVGGAADWCCQGRNACVRL